MARLFGARNLVNRYEADGEGGGRISSISSLSCVHLEALPVCRTTGVAKPSQVHPMILTGPPPPLPGARPDLIALAYASSTAFAVAQGTLPRATSTRTGTWAAVRALPQNAR